MAELTYKCDISGDTAALTWWWEGVPSDDSGPGKDSYFVRVVDMNTSIELVGVAGAEDNAHGEPYTTMVPVNTDIYVQVINEAESFRFEDDEVVMCESAAPVVVDTLPYTGVSDVLLPLALVLVSAGAWILRKFA